jgi:hypothetical protein
MLRSNIKIRRNGNSLYICISCLGSGSTFTLLYFIILYLFYYILLYFVYFGGAVLGLELRACT